MLPGNCWIETVRSDPGCVKAKQDRKREKRKEKGNKMMRKKEGRRPIDHDMIM